MKMDVKFTDQSMRDLQKDLSKLTEADRGKLTKLWSVQVYGNVIKHFEDEKAPDGKWKRFKNGVRQPYYINGKRVDRGGNKLLQREGNLKNSITPFSDLQGGGCKTDLIYAATHNYGRDSIPQREYMWIDDETMEKLESTQVKILTEYWKR